MKQLIGELHAMQQVADAKKFLRQSAAEILKNPGNTPTVLQNICKEDPERKDRIEQRMGAIVAGCAKNSIRQTTTVMN